MNKELVQAEKPMAVTIDYLNTLAPANIAEDERVKNKFVTNYNKIHGSDNGEMVYELEKYHFARIVSSNKDLKLCTKLSLYATFVEMAAQGLSFDPSKKLCYLLPSNVNVGTAESPQWEKRATLEISPYGELSLRQSYGQITHADNPEVVYEKEKFDVTQSATGKQVNHVFSYPREGKVVACYIRLIKPDGTQDYYILDLPGMERLKQYSTKKNKGYANALYESGPNKTPDIGFWVAKTIKHAFKAYPKVKLKGQFTKFQEDPEDEEIDYGMDIRHREVKTNTSSIETAQMTMPEAEEDNGESVVITSNEDLGF